jgi:hypothetical protein
MKVALVEIQPIRVEIEREEVGRMVEHLTSGGPD